MGPGRGPAKLMHMGNAVKLSDESASEKFLVR